MPARTRRPPVRERLLGTAGRLFYREGIRAVGIDRVLAESGVAKSSLYVHFRTKEELVVAYLEDYGQWFREALRQHLDQSGTSGTDAVLAVFEVMATGFRDVDFRGCAFTNAAVEYPDHAPIRAAVAAHRGWLAGRFAELLPADLPLAPAERDALGRRLLQLSTGASMSAYLDRDRDAALTARSLAAALLTPSPAPPPG